MQEKAENFGKETESEEIEVTVSPFQPLIVPKTLEILKYHTICSECLGRQFSFLGTATDNTKRSYAILLSLTMEAHSALNAETLDHHFTIYDHTPSELLEKIAIQAHFYPAFKSLKDNLAKFENEESIDQLQLKWENHQCFLCNNLLTAESIDKMCSEISEEVAEYDFENFLIGTYLNPVYTNKEEDLRARLQISNGESFKANLNRIVGKKLQDLFQKPTLFQKPDLQIMIDLRESIDPIYELQPKSLYLESRYKKFTRELPQTHWNCPECRGRGINRKTREICQTCHGTGDMYPSSVEDLIGEIALKYTYGDKAILHGAGREDIDARCLGSGRPFVMEVKNPQKRIIDLKSLKQEINTSHGQEIYVSDFKISSKKTIIDFKNDSEFAEKEYVALVYLDQPISEEYYTQKMKKIYEELLKSPIQQRTPLRVVHRRADRSREKKIYDISGKYIDSRHILLKIRAQGGTYIKELISSDDGRTFPSIAYFFQIPLSCVELDVISIHKK